MSVVSSLALSVVGKELQALLQGPAVQAAGREPSSRRVKAPTLMVQLLGVLEIAL